MPSDVAAIPTGAAHEAERPALLARLSAAAERRRVELGADLVLVFTTAETVRTALAELLRAERVSAAGADPGSGDEAAVAALAPGPARVAATLFVDIADPVALAGRLAELDGVAERVFLEVEGERVAATGGWGGGLGDGTGATHLVFEPSPRLRAALRGGAAPTVVVDHPGCHARVVLDAAQAGAAIVDLRD